MALVILPCDMPWWGTLQNHIQNLVGVEKVDKLISGLQTIYTMCNVGLDPEEPDVPDVKVLEGFREFLSNILKEDERLHFFNTTLPIIIRYALELRKYKPVTGLPFSLQQEASEIYLDHDFVCSLLAHAFLSTYSKRTSKTHPTLQDINLSNFFPFLNQKFQIAKLKSLIHYFNLQETENKSTWQSNLIRISRLVMKGSDWLTIDDWLECTLPLCPLVIKHDNWIENAESTNSMFVCFSSKRIGGQVLGDGYSRECVQFVTNPELLVTLLCVEALEDNEVVIVDNLINVGKINNVKTKAHFEPSVNINLWKVCLMDAENYSQLPMSQFEEDNILRELNKALLSFRQEQYQKLQQNTRYQSAMKRLPPIGESTSLDQSDDSTMKQMTRRRDSMKKFSSQFGLHLPKGKFIVLGSSGEVLPVSRSICLQNSTHHESSTKVMDCSPEEEFFSARSSLPSEYELCSDEEENARRYSIHLDTIEHRNSFAEKLREALCRAQSSSSTDSSYAVDISVAGSDIADPNIRMKRGGSRGFMLEDEAFDLNQNCEDESNNSEQHAQSNNMEYQKRKGDSSKYSFSTDYNSELEEVYEKLGQWLDESQDQSSIEDNSSEQQKQRDITIIQFAGSLLKRTLSESFVGIPIHDGGDGSEEITDEHVRRRKESMKLHMTARSLSLELAKHKHKLAAQLISAIGDEFGMDTGKDGGMCGPLPVVTGNWGCGSRDQGDPQLKLLIQWLAASVSGLPKIFYYTCNHSKLYKLDTVCRVLVDRQWNVGELVRAVIYYMQFTLIQTDNSSNNTLFNLLINSDTKIMSIKNTFLKY